MSSPSRWTTGDGAAVERSQRRAESRRKIEARVRGTSRGKEREGGLTPSTPGATSALRVGLDASAREEEMLARIDALMLHLAAGERFERLGAIVQEHLLGGGRKLRARLALEALRVFDVEAELGLAWAAACELLHNASLVHDDLQDRDEVRRGKYSVWVRHGEAQAVNAGDLMLMLPFVALEHVPVDGATRWELARAIARRAEETVRGQSLELSLFTSCRFDWASYSEAARGKTSALMCLPVQGAALLAGLDAEEARILADCFKDLGLLFQLQDDVIDLFGEKTGRRRGSDVRDGKVSALVVAHLERRPEDLERLGPILGKPRDETTDQDVELVAAAFVESGALEGVLERIRATERAVLSSPRLLEEPGLHAVARGLVELSLRPIAALLEREVSHA